MRRAAGPEGPVIRFGVLGSLSLELDGSPVALGPLKQQQVLALLLCQANALTSVDVLTETLWNDHPPRTARKNLQVYITCLRKLFGSPGGDDRLAYRNGGYVLRAAPQELDLLRFQQLSGAARQAGSTAERVGCLAEALRLWRGPVLDGLTAAPQLSAEADRLSLRYLAVFEDWADGELALGHAAQVVDQICETADRHPLRERLRQLQMLALSHAGRQAEAFGVFDELRQTFARELGLRPSAATEKLYLAMLDADPGGRPVVKPAATPAARTVLPPDLVDFTDRVDPLRQVEELLAAESRRIAVLAGPVGIGKTSLAVHAAHRSQRLFPDGRIAVGMRTGQGEPRSARSVLLDLARFANLLDRQDPAELAGCDTEELAGRWQSWLMDRKVLLLLDDACEAAATQAVLPLAGGSAVLVTTRRRLFGLAPAAWIELTPFDVAEAVSLLARIVGADRVAADRAAAERIVQAIGRSPLAVRIAGAKLALLRHVSLVDFAARLEHPDELLAELCTGEGVLRHRLAAGLTDLPEPERAALRQLGSLGTSRFTLEQAGTLLAEVPSRARRLLESLIEASVVTVPTAQVSAHAAVYELPRLWRCYLREALA